MSFTSWTDLEIKMKDDMASGNWTVESYTIRNRTTTYRSFEDFKKAYDFVCEQAALERGDLCRRTSVRCS